MIPHPGTPLPHLVQSGPCMMHGHMHCSFTIPKMPLGLALSSTALLQKCGHHSPPNLRSHLTSPWSPLNTIFVILFLLMEVTSQLTSPTSVLNGWQWIMQAQRSLMPTSIWSSYHPSLPPGIVSLGCSMRQSHLRMSLAVWWSTGTALTTPSLS